MRMMMMMRHYGPHHLTDAHGPDIKAKVALHLITDACGPDIKAETGPVTTHEYMTTACGPVT